VNRQLRDQARPVARRETDLSGDRRLHERNQARGQALQAEPAGACLHPAPWSPANAIVVGNGDGEVKLTKLVRHVQKMKKEIQPATQTAIMQKMKALDAMRPAAPMPRGPMPTSVKGARRQMRG